MRVHDETEEEEEEEGGGGEEDGEAVVKETNLKMSDEEYFLSLSASELETLESRRIPGEELEDRKVVCTSCFRQVNHKSVDLVARHPILGVLICKNCKKIYFSGTWRKDELGFFDRCRWCGRSSGEPVTCDKEGCFNNFCGRCIKRNIGRTALTDILDAEGAWECLECDPPQIIEQRAVFYSVFKYWELEKEKTTASELRKRKRELYKSREDPVSKAIFKSENVLKLFKQVISEEDKKWKGHLNDRDNPCPNVVKNSARRLIDICDITIDNVRDVRLSLEEAFDFSSTEKEDEVNGLAKTNGNQEVASDAQDQLNSDSESKLKEKIRVEVLKTSEDETDTNQTNFDSINKSVFRPLSSSESEDDGKSLKKFSDFDLVKAEVLKTSSDDEAKSPDKSNLRSEITDKIHNLTKAYVHIKPLRAPILRVLTEDGAISIQLFEELSFNRGKKVKNPDAEIKSLCDLKNINSSNKCSSSTSIEKKKSPAKRPKIENLDVSDVGSAEEADDDTDESENKETFSKLKSSTNNELKTSVIPSSDEDFLCEESEEEDEAEGGEIDEDYVCEKKMRVSVSKNHSSPASKTRRSAPAFMKMKLDETDSDEAMEKAAKGRRKKTQTIEETEENYSSEVEALDSSGNSLRNRRRSKRKIKSESSEENEANDFKQEEEEDSDVIIRPKKKKKGKDRQDSSYEDSDEEPRSKKKRKRVKKNLDNSSDSNNEDNSSPMKGRKNIKKILKEKKLTDKTKEAAEIERERRKRIEEKRKEYDKEFVTPVKTAEVCKELILDFDPETKKVLVEVDKALVELLKPHQVNGVKFMWDSVFESRKDVLGERFPGGAILAHCMGLGKTLQTITLIHTVLSNFPEHITRVLVICPVNTVKNWKDEFEKWCTGSLELDVYEMSMEKDNWGRADRLDFWFREGGVMIIGYDMYRNLTNESNKRFRKKQKDIFLKSLVDPGPHLVVCDEGHILKNMKSALNASMNKVKSLRRIILTGTPLQNNLSEYFAMVDFVKPNLLGTFQEFKNRFVNPIQNGQHSDSTDRDVRIMKKRSFILSDLLKGCLQRLDYNVLVPYLRPKYEYVLCINLGDFQKKLYKFYLENYARAGQIVGEGKMEGGKRGGIFYDVQILSQIWNHPFILSMAKQRNDLKRMFQDDDEELNNFIINDDDDEESDAKSTSEIDSDEESDCEVLKEEMAPKRRVTRGAQGEEDSLLKGLDEVKQDVLSQDKGWWNKFLDEEGQLEEISLGSKMILLMEILKECEILGDKVLVFSQSLLSLDMIEKFLKRIDDLNEISSSFEHGSDPTDDSLVPYLAAWKPGRNYFRMDGSTAPDVRKKCCNYFNKTSNDKMRLFLISTKAGGLGINLVAANRVIIFDASWNPAHDVQSIFRVYRFGQEKPVYIYRFLAKGTMEEKIYDRQVTKQSLSARVVDEQQIERHFSMNELAELYEFKDEEEADRPVPKVPKDKLLAEIMTKHKDKIWKYHDHDSLLENQVDENLTEEERKAAWEEFENEKKGIINIASTSMVFQTNLANNPNILRNINPVQIQEAYRKQNPHLSEEQISQATRAYIMQLQNAFIRRPTPVSSDRDQSRLTQESDQASLQARLVLQRLQQQRQFEEERHKILLQQRQRLLTQGKIEEIVLDEEPEVIEGSSNNK